MTKDCLTAEIVDRLQPPSRGETWVGDNHLKYFGVRAWSGKKGGGKAFAIRLRDQFGVLVRETFQAERDYPLFGWKGGWDKPLGYFLEYARSWARDRIARHTGMPTEQDRREQRWQRRKAKVLATEIGHAFKFRLDILRRRSRNHLYVDHIQNLVGIHVPADILKATFRDVSVRRLADSISHREMSYGNVKVLRAFVGSVFKNASNEFAPLRWKLEAIQRRCSRNLDARKAPPYPQILRITESDYARFFEMLEAERDWRQALAIRLYFATGAKLQQVLRMRWSDIVDETWYPFVPKDRKLWYESRERLGTDARKIIGAIEQHHRSESLASAYLFPSLEHQDRPIRTIQRHWTRHCGKNGWNGLPISHVVLRHRPRANPSYSLFFYRYYLGSEKSTKGINAVSKVGKRRSDLLITASCYR